MKTGGDRRMMLAIPDAGKRLDRVLTERIGGPDGLSRTRLQALIKHGHVCIDGEAATSASMIVGGVGAIDVTVPPPSTAVPQAQSLALEIIYEDDHLLVLDKPAGLVVHPAAGHEAGTLVNALIAHCGESLSGIGGVKRPGIVHRLDKDTSGLMVVAKSDAAHRGLTDLFADHGRTRFLERRYCALVWGHPSTPAGIVDRPLGRHPHNRQKISVVAEGQGRNAITHWRLAESLHGASLIECRLETGRTHQIRVHMLSIGHPLVGDPVYGPGFRTKSASLSPAAAALASAFPRQALHAATLGFDHPITKRKLTFSAPPPADFASLLDAMRSIRGQPQR